MTKKQRLIEEAKKLGLKVTTRWTILELESRIRTEKHAQEEVRKKRKQKVVSKEGEQRSDPIVPSVKISSQIRKTQQDKQTVDTVEEPLPGGSEMNTTSRNQDSTLLPTQQIQSAQTAKESTQPVVVTPPSGLAARLNPKPVYTGSLLPHLIIEARAGTGKTTTLVEGLKMMRGMGSKIIPSPQQRGIWDQLILSKEAKTVCFVAFNKSIAEELQRRVPMGCDAMTLHSLGMRAIRKTYPTIKVNQYRVSDIISRILGQDIRDLRRDKSIVVKAVDELVGLCKQNLTNLTEEGVLEQLANYYEVDLESEEGEDYREEIFDLIPKVLNECKNIDRDLCIDFNDMIWLPVILGLNVFKYDLLLVDEAQDLNRCQQALAKKAGKRLVFCGDPKQAIYGFVGADCESMPRLYKELSEDGTIEGKVFAPSAGCLLLPLTVTRRCGRAIVEEANIYVKDFEAHESCPEGKISTAKYTTKKRDGETIEIPYEQTYMPLVEDGDMILCRCNAPLVSQCFKFLKRGRKANIQGRDIGKGIINTINKMKASNVTDLIVKITDWQFKEEEKERAKRNPSEAKIISIGDKASCIICFCDGETSIDDVVRKIEAIFTDNRDVPGIRLSSVHKAKGLEARRVFILQPEGATMPHPMAKSEWQYEQELNILYVAITRAIEELVYVR